MKNKRWKRKAKRLLGKCLTNKNDKPCRTCEDIRECIWYCGIDSPKDFSIRELEKKCKEI